jgi:glucose-6-phosphate dehydrogenase assembly protein OpcA
MSDATSDAFLNGQGIPVELPKIEDALAQLWGPAAEREGGPDLEHPAVTRVALANLVVGALRADPARIEGVLDTVVARYPCRAIVLREGPDDGRKVAAEVSALCHLPAPGLPQVCSERIVLRAGAEGLDLLPGAVRPLLEAGLPVVLWWADDPRPHEPLFRALAGEATRLILDLPDPATPAAGLPLALGPSYARDLAWFGITRWRELVAQFFDPPGSEAALAGIGSVEVRAVAPSDEGPPRVAAWLAAWLAGQLGWEPTSCRTPVAGRLAASFRGPSGYIDVELLTEVDPSAPLAHVTGVTLATRTPDGEGSFRLDRHGDDVRVEACAPSYCALPRLVRAPEFDAPRRLAAALESSRDDPPYRNALPHALWLLGDPINLGKRDTWTPSLDF